MSGHGEGSRRHKHQKIDRVETPGYPKKHDEWTSSSKATSTPTSSEGPEVQEISPPERPENLRDNIPRPEGALVPADDKGNLSAFKSGHKQQHLHHTSGRISATYRVSVDECGIYNGMRPPTPIVTNVTTKQPIIIVEPRNDDSMRCDCRNCQFFSGWCCMPCTLIIIIAIVVIWLFIKKTRDSPEISHEQPPTIDETKMVINNNSGLFGGEDYLERPGQN